GRLGSRGIGPPAGLPGAGFVWQALPPVPEPLREWVVQVVTRIAAGEAVGGSAEATLALAEGGLRVTFVKKAVGATALVVGIGLGVTGYALALGRGQEVRGQAASESQTRAPGRGGPARAKQDPVLEYLGSLEKLARRVREQQAKGNTEDV